MSRGTELGNKYPVKSLVKALRVLDLLGTSEHGETLTNISQKLRIGTSTVHRLLGTLRDRGFVWLEPYSSNYVLGAKIFQFVDQASRQSTLIRYGSTVLEELARRTQETCNLGVLEGTEVLYLIKKESVMPLRMSGEVGKRLPAHCTALGKVLLSGLSSGEVDKLYRGCRRLEVYTPATISTVRQLKKKLERVRHLSMAFDNEELYQGVVCIAAPVRNYGGKMIAAVSVSFPKQRLDRRKREELKACLLLSVRDFSLRLGYQTSEDREVAE